MERLRQRDFLIANKCVQEIYAPCPLGTFPDHILSILLKVVPSEVPVYSKINFQRGQGSMTCPSLDPLYIKQMERIAHQHFHEHPFICYYLQTGDGKVRKISDFISESQLHQLPGLYEQYLQPLGMEDQIGFVLPSLAPMAQKGLHQSEEALKLLRCIAIRETSANGTVSY